MIEHHTIVRCDVCGTSTRTSATRSVREAREYCCDAGWVCARDGSLDYCPKCRETKSVEQLDGARRRRSIEGVNP